MSLIYRCEACGRQWLLQSGPLEQIQFGMPLAEAVLRVADGHECNGSIPDSRSTRHYRLD